MKTLITRIKRLALALCLATPIVSWAAYTTIGYEDFGDTAGVVLWRGATDSANFHQSTAVNVAADGTEGDPATLNWNEFCSSKGAYSAPGKLLVYDATGYRASSNADFDPLSLGGLWVKALASEAEGSESTPYSVTGSGSRYTDFGAAGYSTYFKFQKSFSIERASDIRCYGNVTIDVASGATFRNTTALWIENNSTVALTGEGTVELSNGLRMNASSTLDLSAATRPTIYGDVTIPAGATLVLPAGTELDADVEIDICFGALTVNGIINVKVGDADAVDTIVTTSDGKITRIDTGITYTADFPTTVPAGSIYIYVGGETAEGAVGIAGVTVNGKLKTQGYVNLTDLTVSNGGTLEVVDGNTTAVAYNDGYDNIIRGNIIVRAGATLTTTQNDFLDWYGATNQRLDIYGTLALGNTRWSVKTATKCVFNLYPGARVTGAGDSNGVIDLIEDTSKLNVYRGDNGGEVVIEGKLKTRNANTPIWVAADTTLKVGGFNNGVNKSGNGTLEISGNISNPGNSTVSEGTVAFVDTTVALPLTVNAGKTVTASASEGVTVPLNVTMNASANITVSGAGTVNGSVTFGGFPTGTLTGLTTSTWQGTVTVPAASGNISKLASCGNADSVIDFAGTTGSSYIMASGNTTYNVGAINFSGATVLDNGSSGSTVNFAKISGDGDLTLSSWGGCSSARYNLNKIEGYTGTLTVKNGITRDQGGTFTIGIGNIVTENTTPGACVLPIVNESVESPTGTVVYNLSNATLNGAAADLEVKEDGIYIVVPVTTVEITVTPVTGATASVTADGQPVEIVDGKVTVDIGAAVSVTYTANDGYVVTGSPVEFTATAETTSVDTSTVVPALILATITSADGQTVTPYTDVATAFAAVADYETLTLVGSSVSLTDDVAIDTSFTLAGDAEGTTVSGTPGRFQLNGSVAMTLAETVTVTKQFQFKSKTATLTFPTDKVPTVRPYTAGGCQTGTRDNGDGTSTYYQYLFLQLQVGASNVTLAYYDGGAAVESKQVNEGDELVFTATPAEGYENPVVTVNGEPISPVDGKYTVVVGTVNVIISATATAMPKVAEIVGGDQYTTLAAAVAGATTGDTVKLLTDVTLDARVEPNLGSGTTLTIDLGGFKITRTGTGGNGSAFDVKSGTVTIKNGEIDCTQDDTEIAKDGVYAITARAGANVTLETLTVTVDSECGACVYPFSGANVTILGGTYANTTTTPYRYKLAWTGMAVNQINKDKDGNALNQRITIYGGTFSKVNPALGDDSWADGEGTFLAEGYQSTETSTGVWTVTVKPSGIDPESVDPQPLDVDPEAGETDAQEAAEAQMVTVTTEVANVLEAAEVSADTYQGYFTKTAVRNVADTAWLVKTEIRADIVEDVNEDAVTELTEAIADTTAETVTVTKIPVGLYYKVESLNALGGDAIDFAIGLSGVGDAPTVDKPTADGQGFIRVTISASSLED